MKNVTNYPALPNTNCKIPMLASSNGHFEIVQYLIETKASINIASNNK